MSRLGVAIHVLFYFVLSMLFVKEANVCSLPFSIGINLFEKKVISEKVSMSRKVLFRNIDHCPMLYSPRMPCYRIFRDYATDYVICCSSSYNLFTKSQRNMKK